MSLRSPPSAPPNVIRRAATALALLGLGFGCAAAPGPSRPGYAIEQTVPAQGAADARGVAEAPQVYGGASTSTAVGGEPQAGAEGPKKLPQPTAAPGTSPTAAAPVTKAMPPPPSVAEAGTDAAKKEPTASPRYAAKVAAEEPALASEASGGHTPAAPRPTVLPGSPAIQIAAAQANFEEASRQLGAASGDCARLCKALASMQRATERLCGLVSAGSESEKRRCFDARAKLSAATAKVNATCGACSVP